MIHRVIQMIALCRYYENSGIAERNSVQSAGRRRQVLGWWWPAAAKK